MANIQLVLSSLKNLFVSWDNPQRRLDTEIWTNPPAMFSRISTHLVIKPSFSSMISPFKCPFLVDLSILWFSNEHRLKPALRMEIFPWNRFPNGLAAHSKRRKPPRWPCWVAARSARERRRHHGNLGAWRAPVPAPVAVQDIGNQRWTKWAKPQETYGQDWTSFILFFGMN